MWSISQSVFYFMSAHSKVILHTHTHTHTHSERQTDRHTNTHTHTHTHTEWETDRQTQTNRQTERARDRETDRQTDRQTESKRKPPTKRNRNSLIHWATVMLVYAGIFPILLLIETGTWLATAAKQTKKMNELYQVAFSGVHKNPKQLPRSVSAIDQRA